MIFFISLLYLIILLASDKIASLIASAFKRRGNWEEAKKAFRTFLTLHSLKAGDQLRTRKRG
jgi:hypothetical protein